MPEGPLGVPRPFASSDLVVEVVLSNPVVDIPSKDMIEREFVSQTGYHQVEFKNLEVDGAMRGIARVGVDKPLPDYEVDNIATTMAEIAHDQIPAGFEQTIESVQITTE